MDDILLYGEVNPAIVSKIVAFRGRRCFRPHPYYYKLHKKRFGIFSWKNEPDIFKSFFIPASVEILGSDGDVVLRISCKSNDSANKLRDELTKQLETWVKNSYAVKVKDKE